MYSCGVRVHMWSKGVYTCGVRERTHVDKGSKSAYTCEVRVRTHVE